jgi:hypothetical protein
VPANHRVLQLSLGWKSLRPAPGVLRWTGEIPPQKWMNFYTRVLSKFASGQGLTLTLSVEVAPEGGISSQRIEETRRSST